MKKREDTRIVRGSENVFADLERPDAVTHLLRAELLSRIDEVLRKRKYTQAQAAKVLGISQPDVSRLLRGQFRDFSVERLLRWLLVLGQNVEIAILAPLPRRGGRLRVTDGIVPTAKPSLAKRRKVS